jgi:hypothetical protein
MLYYHSKYISSTLACWIEATLHSLDTHAKWDATLCYRVEGNPAITKAPLFQLYLCDSEMFFDWIKRRVIGSVNKAPQNDIDKHAWHELQETLEACKSFYSLPLTDEAVHHQEKYREPSNEFSYEVVVDSFTEESVSFNIKLWGYKYALENLNLPKDQFYIITDRLDARIRFLNEWTSILEAVRPLRFVLQTSPLLAPVKNEIESFIKTYSIADDNSLDMACRALLPTLELLLRETAITRKWNVKSKKLDGLIRTFIENKSLSDDTEQMLQLIAKPFRDTVSHGRHLATPVAKVLIVTIMDLFVRLSYDWANADSSN